MPSQFRRFAVLVLASMAIAAPAAAADDLLKTLDREHEVLVP